MNVLFVGLGSIGTRHLRNLHMVCRAKGIQPQVTALRSRAGAPNQQRNPLVHRQLTTLPGDEHFDIAFIANPTNLHAAALQQLKGRVSTFFIEKPIFENTACNLEALGLGPGQKAYVAAPMRWCGVYAALKQRLAQVPPYSVRAICSSYLPNWRQGVDYRTVYSAKKDMGGGVALDLIHEWDYLVDLFGLPQSSVGLTGKFSHLEIDADDLAVYVARYPGFLCELHLDYFGREYRREVEVFSAEGSLRANFGTGELFTPDGVENYAEDPNQRYLREMEYFLNYALHQNGESVNSPAKALRVLQLALGEL